MALVTRFTVVSFVRDAGGSLAAGQIDHAANEWAAKARAKIAADRFARVIAFSRTFDADMYSAPRLVILAQLGDVPEDLSSLINLE